MPVPLPQFSAAPPTQVYSPAGNPVVFHQPDESGHMGILKLWKFGDGTTSSSQTSTHTYTALGTYNVVLTVSNANCSDSVKHQVSVTPEKPIANFDSIPSDCEPLTININNTTTHTDIPGTTYRRLRRRRNIDSQESDIYLLRSGTYKIELIVTGPGGTTSHSQVVSSYPLPKAYFESSTDVCLRE